MKLQHMIFPKANLKAKDLPQDYLPHKEILKAYEDANQQFEFDSDATGEDRVWRHHFWPQVNGNVRIKNQEIEQQISGVYRVKDSKGEWLMYHILLHGVNHTGERKDFSDLIGKIEGIPVFERRVNPDSGEVEY